MNSASVSFFDDLLGFHIMMLDWMCLVLEFAEGEVSGGGHEEGGTPDPDYLHGAIVAI
jgi:hypothetical protein